MEGSEPSTSSATSSGSATGGHQSDNTNNAGAEESSEEFLSSGRTGRRNAMPDILEEKDTHTSTSELPSQLEKLSFNEPTHPNGSSGESSGSASCSKQSN